MKEGPYYGQSYIIVCSSKPNSANKPGKDVDILEDVVNDNIDYNHDINK